MGIIGSKINRDLPENQYQAAVNANLPTAINPYATIADLIADNQDLQEVMDIGATALITGDYSIKSGTNGATDYVGLDVNSAFGARQMIIQAIVANGHSLADINVGASNATYITEAVRTVNRVEARLENSTTALYHRTRVTDGTNGLQFKLETNRFWLDNSGAGYDNVATYISNMTDESVALKKYVDDSVPDTLYTGNGITGPARKVQVTDTFTIRDLADATTLLSINQSNGNITTSESGGRWRHGDFALTYSEMVGAVQLQAAVGGGATWSGFHAYNNANALGVQVSLAANKFGSTQIRTSHNLYFSTNWTGGFGTSSIERMRLHAATGNFSIGTPSDIGRLGVRGSDNSGLTKKMTFESLSGIDQFVMMNDGRTSWASNNTAFVNGTIGHAWRTGGLTYGMRLDSSNDSLAAFWIQQAGLGRDGIFVAMNSTQVGGTVHGAQFDNKSSLGQTHVGVRGFAWNGSTYTIGVDGAVSTSGVASVGYLAGVRGSASGLLNVLQYGGKFVAQYNAAGVAYTQDSIGVEASAIGTTGAAGSTGKVVGIKAFTSGIAGTGDRIAIWMPLAGNNGVAVLGANARNGNATLQVTGGMTLFGNGTGFRMYQPDGTPRDITLNNAGGFVIT